LALGEAEAPTGGEDLLAGARAMLGRHLLRELAGQLAHALPVPRRLGHVVVGGPLRGAPVPERRARGVARLVPVVSEERGLLVDALAALRLDRARDRGVDAPAPVLELRGERHLLRERVLERVLRDGIERLVVDELRGLEQRQRLGEL